MSHSRFLTRNELQQTPLARAISQGNRDEVESCLHEGAASSVFVHGYFPSSLVCTLPQAVQPASTGTLLLVLCFTSLSNFCAVFHHPPPLKNVDKIVTKLLDDAIDKWVRETAEDEKNNRPILPASDNISSVAVGLNTITNSTPEVLNVG
jgi:hypothetical protein